MCCVHAAGYTEVAFSGEGVSDRLLIEVSKQAGPKLTKCKLQSSSSVTDAGLCQLVASSGNLQSLSFEDLSKSVSGECLRRSAVVVVVPPSTGPSGVAPKQGNSCLGVRW